MNTALDLIPGKIINTLSNSRQGCHVEIEADMGFCVGDTVYISRARAQPAEAVDVNRLTAAARAMHAVCDGEDRWLRMSDEVRSRWIESVRPVAAALAHPRPTGGRKEAIAVLLTHLEDVLDDENFERIDVSKWNAVSILTAPTGEQAGEVVAIYVNAVDDDGSLLYVHPPIAKRGDTLYTQPRPVGVPDGWKPIESAPKGVKIIAGYRNSRGNWRSIMACYYTPGTLELADDADDTEDGYAPEGWYEATEVYEEIRLTDEKPTHWMPLAAAPEVSS